MLQHIKTLLGRFSSLSSTRHVRERVAAHITAVTGFPTSNEALRYQRGTVYLAVPPLVRGEILLKKESILKRLHEELPGTVKDLR
ncbi:hypothetical protein A3D66_03145 [Candidatus Kaiserbacteria bacterium RIFCSPHIGHO2_02_FULL_50_9]|uniref:Uncharacterized protein n=1 Tax=Candidatus Kaiserbacteria bacterium RIFCSPLOWO2_01_FULL_51_21 TaxID=1798508 RepID=A0A1F6EDA1_9BACT|nr:MAG: hypothetical protein A2761_02525 [Candidatus Kaiserbacteria bacterium RIFCSPHIGHO2_01_FULL_51_33]OGG63670.1 MAG: hypothetical protein A3D66_03145 [Candidatus Kaiserbacteria bacterium RIFCSPHIGHO2_02_FULL_50_9]OGG71655.1 MAG: hypothetical protein A3A35_00615 [Candidatus Kaiserbacteria bacterium RIFCSPLOWO2_01_FULL_51_21]